MSALDLTRYNDDYKNYGFIAAYATLIHVTRLASLFALVYDIAIKCNWKNPRNGREINFKTQLIYALICILEIAYCRIEKIDNYMRILTLSSATASLFMIIIISINVLLLNDPENDNDCFSWLPVLPIFVVSYVIILFFTFFGKHGIIILSSSLNNFALIPQYCVYLKLKRLKISIWIFLIGMIVHTCLIIAGEIDMIRVYGLKYEYQHVFFGVLYSITFLCCWRAYRRKNNNSDDKDNQIIGKCQTTVDEVSLSDVDSNDVSQEEQREAANNSDGFDNNLDGLNEKKDVVKTTVMINPQPEFAGEHRRETSIEIGNDNNPGGLNEENRDFTKTKKRVNFQPDIVDQQSHLKATNSGAGAADDNEEAGRNEDNQGIRKTRI